MRSDYLEKIKALEIYLKSRGKWSNAAPAWVSGYQAEEDRRRVDFFEWLQFIYLPNKATAGGGLQVATGEVKGLVSYARQNVPQQELTGDLLRMLIELDNL